MRTKTICCLAERVVATTLAPRGHHAAVNAAMDGRTRLPFVVAAPSPLSSSEGIACCPAWMKSSRQRLKPQSEKILFCQKHDQPKNEEVISDKKYPTHPALQYLYLLKFYFFLDFTSIYCISKKAGYIENQ
jgi:hypothetical protein